MKENNTTDEDIILQNIFPTCVLRILFIMLLVMFDFTFVRLIQIDKFIGSQKIF